MKTANKSVEILRITTRDSERANALKSDFEILKTLLNQDGISDIDTLEKALKIAIKALQPKEIIPHVTRADKNRQLVQECVEKQMITNADNTTVTLDNGVEVFVNKRFISSYWVQSELGISFNAIKEFFDDEKNQEMLKNHHDAMGIMETQNRLAAKALKKV